MKLETATHRFEFLTPAWIGGANPAASAEVRVPTIRGHLRQWLRLLYPGQNLDDAIFGRIAGEGANAAAQASLVQLSLAAPVRTGETKNLLSYTGANNDAAALQDAESYFLWPLRKQSRGVLMPRVSNQFQLLCRWFPARIPATGTLRSALDKAILAMGLLGNIGTRATRGYGSVWHAGKDLASEAEFSELLAFLPDTISVRLLNGDHATDRAALACAARWMRSFRIGSARFGRTTPEAVNDHDVADPLLNPSPNARVYRQALGMPLAQRYNRNNNVTTVQSRHHHDGFETDRYPSPLRIKVVRFTGRYRVAVVLLNDLLLPEGTQITLTNRPTRHDSLDHGLLDQMKLSGSPIH